MTGAPGRSPVTTHPRARTHRSPGLFALASLVPAVHGVGKGSKSGVVFVTVGLVGSERPRLEALAPTRRVLAEHPQVTPSVSVVVVHGHELGGRSSPHRRRLWTRVDRESRYDAMTYAPRAGQSAVGSGARSLFLDPAFGDSWSALGAARSGTPVRRSSRPPCRIDRAMTWTAFSSGSRNSTRHRADRSDQLPRPKVRTTLPAL